MAPHSHPHDDNRPPIPPDLEVNPRLCHDALTHPQSDLHRSQPTTFAEAVSTAAPSPRPKSIQHPTYLHVTSNRRHEPPLSFAAVTAKPKASVRFPELHLSNRNYGTKDGAPAVSFSAIEYKALTARFENTLIAKFQPGRPSLQEIKKFMIENWSIKGRVTISSNWDDRHIVIILDSTEDVTAALTYPIRKVGHCLFRLYRWTEDYNPRKENTWITKWIRLPGLPMQFFDKACIKAIVSSFAEFLDIDDRTKELSSLSFARACVELDIEKEIPNQVWINLPDNKGFFQDIIVEGTIAYCRKCHLHGHDVSTCKKAMRKRDNEKRKSSLPKDDHHVPQPKPISKPSQIDESKGPGAWYEIVQKRFGKRKAVQCEDKANMEGDLNRESRLPVRNVTVSSPGLIHLQNSIDAMVNPIQANVLQNKEPEDPRADPNETSFSSKYSSVGEDQNRDSNQTDPTPWN